MKQSLAGPGSLLLGFPVPKQTNKQYSSVKKEKKTEEVLRFIIIEEDFV